MHLYPVRRTLTFWRVLCPLLLAVAVLLLFLVGFFRMSGTAEEERQQALERAVRKSLVSCYAIEGAYPDSLSYLEEHYGLQIDHSRYVVDYEPFGDNIWPTVQIVRRGGGSPPTAVLMEGGGAG